MLVISNIKKVNSKLEFSGGLFFFPRRSFYISSSLDTGFIKVSEPLSPRSFYKEGNIPALDRGGLLIRVAGVSGLVTLADSLPPAGPLEALRTY